MSNSDEARQPFLDRVPCSAPGQLCPPHRVTQLQYAGCEIFDVSSCLRKSEQHEFD